MSWILFQWIWRLEAPVFVGMSPAGALNRCRVYVPARTIKGAVTAELARMEERNGTIPDYNGTFDRLGKHCRFTYLYPAKKENKQYSVWLPQYGMAEKNEVSTQKEGLCWHCSSMDFQKSPPEKSNHKNNENFLSHREFRQSLLDTRPGTAISPETDSASEGSLRETECINPWWRTSDCVKNKSEVLLFGYVFMDNSGHQEQLEKLATLFVGGDTRYGLGKICRVEWRDISSNPTIFGKPVHLDKENPETQSKHVLAHTLVSSQTNNQDMQGAKELLSGWDRDTLDSGKLAWVPGSGREEATFWSIDETGYWKK